LWCLTLNFTNILTLFMSNYTKVWVVVNYFSGSSTPKQIQHLKATLASYPSLIIKDTKYAKHAGEIAQEAINQQVQVLIVIGGDGTINEVASVLKGSNVAMGIVPKGSGNGLATHIGAHKDPAKQIDNILNGLVRTIDVGMLNNHPFVCTAGMGFDANVAHTFAGLGRRGLPGYLMATWAEIKTYTDIPVSLLVDGQQMNPTLFSLTFANAGQYGNNAWIAPLADLEDSSLQLVAVRRFPWYMVPYNMYRLFTKQIHKSHLVDTIKFKELELTTQGPIKIHLDGEPITIQGNSLTVKILPEKLKLIY
jgi:YegS/Rv2252/BmrU family lipid kinase